MDEKPRTVSGSMTEEEMERRHEEIWAKHPTDPLVRQAAWDQYWSYLITKVVMEMYGEEAEEKESED